MLSQGNQEQIRTAKYRKEHHSDQVLSDANNALVPLERGFASGFQAPHYPTLFIVGAPRSGTTLLSQLLITRFEIGYINNIAARFWMAPSVGALLAQTLKDSYRPPAVGFKSDLGATPEYEGPHEFGFFWRRWFDYGETHQLSAEQTDAIDKEFLKQEVAAIENVFNQPLLFKNVPALSLQVDFLAATFPNAIFVHCRRDPLYTAQSLLLSRLKYYENRNSWFSIKPKEYVWLEDRPYAEQIAGQIFYTLQKIEKDFSSLAPSRHITIQYESLCENPEVELGRVADLFAGNGYELSQRDGLLPDLSTTNRKKVTDDEFEQLAQACRQFFNKSFIKKG